MNLVKKQRNLEKTIILLLMPVIVFLVSISIGRYPVSINSPGGCFAGRRFRGLRWTLPSWR